MGIERTGLDILIRTPGTKETADEINKVADATAGVGDAAKKAAPALAEDNARTKEATGYKKVFKDSLKELQHAFHGVGQAMLLLKNPITIVVGALSTAITAVYSYIQSVNELAKTNSVHEAVSKSMLMLGGAARDAAQGLIEFNSQLAEGAENAKNYADELGRVEAAIEKAAQREAAKRDAKEGLAIARVNAAESEKKITPDRAIAARLEIKNHYEEQREQARQKAEAEKIEAKGEAIRKTQEARIRAEAQIPDAMKQAAEDQRAAEAAPKKAESDLTDIDQRLAAAKERKEKLLRQRGGFQMGVLERVAEFAPEGSAAGRAPGGMRAQIDTGIDEADKDIGQLEQERFMAEKTPGRAAEKAKKSGARASGLKTIIETARDTEGTLFEDIVTGKQAHETDTRSRREEQGTQRETRGINAESEIKESLRRQEEEKRKQQEREAREQERQEREIKRHLFDRGGASLEIKEPDSNQVQQAASRVVAAIEKNNAVILAAFSRIEMTANNQGGKIATLFTRNAIGRIV